MTEEQKKKVLIVDDDRFLLNMYSVKFKKSGYEMYTASNGQEALNKIRNSVNPDVLIVDIIMPGMDGLQLLENVRKENLVANAAIIVLSNQGQAPDIEKAKKLGVDGYIVKASTIPSEVVTKVGEIVKNKGIKSSQ